MPSRPTRAPCGHPRLGDAGEPEQPPGLLDVPAAAADDPADDRRRRPRRRRHHAGAGPGSRARRVALGSALGVGRLGSRAASASSARRSGSVSSDRQTSQVGEADGERQVVQRRWSRAAGATATAPTPASAPYTTTGHHHERRASRPAHAKSAPRNSRMTSDQHRLVPVPEDRDRALGHQPRRQPDDQLGDRDDRGVPDGHRHRDEVAGREPGQTGHETGQRPRAAGGPHASDCGSGMIAV